MSDGARKAVHVRLSGRVQGVFFRNWTEEEAQRRGLSGWVRNVRDGTVEAVFAGPAEQVDDMVALCWQGPSAAYVTDVQAEATSMPTGTGFRKAPTV